jgi:hypothetical protein
MGMPCNWNQTNMGACNPYSNLSYSTYYNPYLMYYNQMYQPGAQAALAWRAQFMFDPGFRINSGLYYPTSSPYSNVYVAQYPSYTPTSCACYTTPCDCEAVISRSTVCYSGKLNRRNMKRIAKGKLPRGRGVVVVQKEHCDPTHNSGASKPSSNSGSGSPSEKPATSSNQTPPSNQQAPSDNIFRPNLQSDDAEQLYIRLALKEEREQADGKDRPFPIKKTGANYWCSKGSKNDFTCEINFNLDQGLLLPQQSSASGPGAAELPVGNITNDYSGAAVSILRSRPDLANIRIRDGQIESQIERAFQKLNGSGKDANSNDQIADLGYFRISKIPHGSGYIYEIELRVKTETGEAIKVSDWI